MTYFSKQAHDKATKQLGDSITGAKEFFNFLKNSNLGGFYSNLKESDIQSVLVYYYVRSSGTNDIYAKVRLNNLGVLPKGFEVFVNRTIKHAFVGGREDKFTNVEIKIDFSLEKGFAENGRPDWRVEKCKSNCCIEPTHKVTKCCDCPNCSAVKLEYAICYTCGLEQIHHRRHHGLDFCRAERELQGLTFNNVALDPSKMYLKINDTAADFCFGSGQSSLEFRKSIFRLEGTFIEVETEHLFNNQYNTVPVAGVSEKGLRILHDTRIVDGVVNDAREGRKRCGYCGKHTDDAALVCENCGKIEYFEPLKMKVWGF